MNPITKVEAKKRGVFLSSGVEKIQYEEEGDGGRVYSVWINKAANPDYQRKLWQIATGLRVWESMPIDKWSDSQCEILYFCVKPGESLKNAGILIKAAYGYNPAGGKLRITDF